MIPKNYEEFQESLKGQSPPDNWSLPLQALWYDAKGDWESSHDIAQDIHSPMGSWIHAYLHRKEGDRWNAQYWYNNANRPFPDYSSSEELRVLVENNL
ncbi:hypothetical protein [Flagellimonas aequoris]|uniref:Uncharacterized protein n=1 Tax=Flagellimonas aequoris TaxID=2306997 RepID=A0A418N3S7_9FLAO|nr:hypothetical protein [Allomuricauda aequoris]RIV68488.1 hypothetical protein D2U88_14830 [Allomuricauda aequoris]TXK00183.1 hypothetical protein FQ019_14670 [Allomuricauda aequoris]